MNLSAKLRSVVINKISYAGKLLTWFKLDSTISYSIVSIGGNVEEPEWDSNILIDYKERKYRLVGKNGKTLVYYDELDTTRKMNGVEVKNTLPGSPHEIVRTVWWKYLEEIAGKEVAKQFVFQESNHNGKLWVWDGQGGLKEG